VRGLADGSFYAIDLPSALIRFAEAPRATR
jgi:hypothetical protein